MSSDFAWYFLSLKGRISRQEYWLGYGMVIAILFLLSWKLEDLSFYIRRPTGRAWYRDEIDLALGLPKLVAAGILIWPLTAIYVKLARFERFGLVAAGPDNNLHGCQNNDHGPLEFGFFGRHHHHGIDSGNRG